MGKIESQLSAVAANAEEATAADALDSHFSFTIRPPLPRGMSLCRRTGLISGCPEEACDTMAYFVCVQANSRLELAVAEPPQLAVSIDIGFAEQIEAVEDVAQLCPEP